jgi:calcineurin-like phosphoesterase family protein
MKLKQLPYFISDLHVGHKNIIRFDKRPFANLTEMHSEIIKRWNASIKENDCVFILGDLYFGHLETAKWFYHQLKGRLFVIKGNHDKMERLEEISRFEKIWEYGTEISIGEEKSLQKIVLSHYPILEWNGAHRGTWHLHGHTHGGLLKTKKDFRNFYYSHKVLDVGCLNTEYKPIHYSEIEKIMAKRELWKHH